MKIYYKLFRINHLADLTIANMALLISFRSMNTDSRVEDNEAFAICDI